MSKENFIGEIYQVYTNLYTLELKPIKIVRKTDSCYWTTSKGDRHFLNSNYHTSFDKLEDAQNYMKYKIERGIDNAKSSLEHYEKMLVSFENLHGKKE